MSRSLRVAVIQPPLVLGPDFIDYPWFANLGAVHTTGVVRAAGFPVRLLDAFSTYGANLYPYEDGSRFWGVPVPRLLAPLEEEPADVVVVHHPPFLYLDQDNPLFRELIRRLRDRLPTARVVLSDGYLGAMHYVDHDRAAVLRRYPGVDYACQYETDVTLPALLAAIGAGAAPPRGGPAAERVVRQRSEPALDDLPLPAWDLVSEPDYAGFLRGVFDRSRRVNPFRVAPDTRPIVTSRGCVYRCVFCATNPWAGRTGAHRFRAHGLERLRELLRLLRRTQDAWHVNVLDQAANLNPAFGDVLALFDEEGFAYDYPNGLRADRLSDEHLERMKGRIGTLSISAESGNQRVVDEVVRKKLPLGEVERVARTAGRLGIPLVIHYMIGLPGETRREILDTFAFALRLHEDHGAEPLVSFATPMVGTELWRMARDLGLADRTEATPQHERVQHRATVGTERVGVEELERALRAFRRRVRAGSTRKVVVNLSYRCINHCRFCAVGNPDGERTGGTHAGGTTAVPGHADESGASRIGRATSPRGSQGDVQRRDAEDTEGRRGGPTVGMGPPLQDEGLPLRSPRSLRLRGESNVARGLDTGASLHSDGLGTTAVPGRGVLVGLEETAREDAAIDEVMRVLDAYHAEGIRLVDFDGGEPLLHPRHIQAIRHARRRGYERVTLTTNGRLLAYEAAACDLLASGLHALLVSVHGATAATHDGLTRTPGSFDQTMEGLANVQRLRQPGVDLGVNTTLTTTNLGELGALAERLAALGVDRWNLQLLTPFGRATDALVPSPDALRAALGPLLERWGEPLAIQVVNAPLCLLPGAEDRVVGDIAKGERKMVFVTKEHVNLADYLALKRTYTDRCGDCLYRPACAGEYAFGREPCWT